MTKKEIINAIERTIAEARELEKGDPNDCDMIAINKYRAGLEAELDMYDNLHPGPIRSIVISLMFPVSIVLVPVIVAGYLTYQGGRIAYEKIRERYSSL